MCYRCFRMFLLVAGIVLLFVAGFPVLAVVPLNEAWEPAFMASKLVMLPAGALCLLGAAGLKERYGRR